MTPAGVCCRYYEFAIKLRRGAMYRCGNALGFYYFRVMRGNWSCLKFKEGTPYVFDDRRVNRNLPIVGNAD